jgi:hypothetical protein
VSEIFWQLGTTWNAEFNNGDQVTFIIGEQNGIDWSGSQGSIERLHADSVLHQDRGYWLLWWDPSLLGTPGASALADWSVDTTQLSGSPQRTFVVPASLLAGVDPSQPEVTPAYYPGAIGRLPDGLSVNKRKVMLGNPFPEKLDVSSILVTDPGLLSGAPYYPLGGPIADAIIEDSTAWVWDADNPTIGNGQNYSAVLPNTPGFDNTIAPYQGFWVILPPSQPVADSDPRILLPQGR